MTAINSDGFAIMYLYGDAGVNDVHLLADAHCTDAEIVRWLARGRRRRRLARVAHLFARSEGEAGDGALGMAAGSHRDAV